MARSGEFNRRAAGVIALVLAGAPIGLAADKVKRWRGPDGQLHLSIEGSKQARPEAAEDGAESDTRDRASTQASLGRRAIERALRAAGAELEAIRSELRAAEARKMVVTAPPAPRDPAEMQLVLDAQRDAFLRAHAFREEQAAETRALRRQRRAKLREIVGLWADFDRLRAEVRAEHGGSLPDWWRDRLDCGGCPGAAEAKQALRKKG